MSPLQPLGRGPPLIEESFITTRSPESYIEYNFLLSLLRRFPQPQIDSWLCFQPRGWTRCLGAHSHRSSHYMPNIPRRNNQKWQQTKNLPDSLTYYLPCFETFKFFDSSLNSGENPSVIHQLFSGKHCHVGVVCLVNYFQIEKEIIIFTTMKLSLSGQNKSQQTKVSPAPTALSYGIWICKLPLGTVERGFLPVTQRTLGNKHIFTIQGYEEDPEMFLWVFRNTHRLYYTSCWIRITLIMISVAVFHDFNINILSHKFIQ